MSKIEIKARDGICPCYGYRAAGAGPSPAVLIFINGLGIGPAMLPLGERRGTHGYFALLPDLFYRAGACEPMNPEGRIFRFAAAESAGLWSMWPARSRTISGRHVATSGESADGRRPRPRDLSCQTRLGLLGFPRL